LIEYLSEVERDKLKNSIKKDRFADDEREALVSILSRLGCRDMANPTNLMDLMEKVARFEFCCKPNAAVAMMYSGVPSEHRDFWEKFGVAGIQKLYTSLSVTRYSV